MQFFDSHTHVNLAAFDEDRHAVIERALEAGVGLNNVGTMLSTSKRAVELAERYFEGVYATVGLHPVQTSVERHDSEEIGEYGKPFMSRGEAFEYAAFQELAQHEQVIAIGECGLDYFRVLDGEAQQRQVEIFEQQIALAAEIDKPLMLHIRSGKGGDAYNDVLDILEARTTEHPNLRGNAHFYAGSIEQAKRFFDINFTISFTGVITFTHDYDEVISYAPVDMLHAETDAPYVAPAPYRGKRNEPAYVKYVVERMAEIKNMDIDVLGEQFLQNAERVYGVR